MTISAGDLGLSGRGGLVRSNALINDELVHDLLNLRVGKPSFLRLHDLAHNVDEGIARNAVLAVEHGGPLVELIK